MSAAVDVETEADVEGTAPSKSYEEWSEADEGGDGGVLSTNLELPTPPLSMFSPAWALA